MQHLRWPAAGFAGTAGTRLPLAIFTTALALTLALILWASNRTLGLTDEIYYLWWTDHPNDFQASIHPFGLLLHPLFELSGRSIIILRVVGTIALALSGFVLGTSIRDFYGRSLPDSNLGFLPIAGMLFGLLYYIIWILTPNYNMLANIGGALVVAGLLGWTDRRRGLCPDAMVSIIVGFGGAICFFGKPTLALVAGLCAAIVWFAEARHAVGRAFARAAIAGCTAIFVTIGVIMATMPLSDFIASVQTGLAVLNFGNSPTTLPLKSLREVSALPAYTIISLAGLLLTMYLRATRRSGDKALRTVKSANRAWFVLLIFACGFLAALAVHRQQTPWYFVSAPALALTAGWISLCLSENDDPRYRTRQLAPILALLILPFATAFGTANDLVFQTGLSLYAWAMACAVATATLLPVRYHAASHGMVALSCVALVTWSAFVPFDMPASIFAQRIPVVTRFSPDTLFVDAQTAADIRGLQTIGAREGIDAETPILDFSGTGPVNAAMLGGRPPFFPWILPQYENAAHLANAAWQHMTAEERRRVWIIGPVLPVFRSDPTIAKATASTTSYRRVGTFRHAARLGHPVIGIWAPATDGAIPNGRP